MTAQRPRFDALPRGLTDAEWVGYLGRGTSWLNSQRRNQLYDLGFPRPDPITGRTDRLAIDAWLDRRNGLSGGGEYDGGLSRRLEEFGNGTA